jgi:hypothetical protein
MTLPKVSTTLGTIPMTIGTVPTTKETSATVKETPSRVTEMTPSWQVMGGGKREFHRAKDAKAAKSQRDAMTIAQPFMAGSGVNKMKKSREGRQKNRVGCPQWWPCASTFRPWRDFGRLRASSPSHKWLGYFQGQRRDDENGNRDGRDPQQCPSRAANGSLGWTNGANGVCIFSHRWNTDFSKPVRAGIFVASPATNGQSSVRSDIIGRADGRCRPDGAGIHFGFGSTNMPRLTALGSVLTIAQPFMAGSSVHQNLKVPRGTAENVVAVRNHLSSLAGLWTIAGHESQP